MPDAVRGYLGGATAKRAELLGVFLCPASRLPELITELNRAKPGNPVPLSLVIDTGLGGVPKAVSIVESRTELLDLRMIEMPAPSDVDEVWLERVAEFVPEDVTRVVEPRRGGAQWLDSIRLVAERGCQPKIRCGGLRAENFPTVDEVADFVSVVTGSGVAFKATAGLHNAVRHTDADTGFTHHGFLNLLVATARAISGGDVAGAIAETDGAALAGALAALSEADAKAVRAVFASYGSCSLAEPVTDLEALELL
ncbi:MAG: hypothetical protein J2O49_06245 [Sciscionella sp.]|nr:hypothetical protein [Sciscionella sp.]